MLLGAVLILSALLLFLFNRKEDSEAGRQAGLALQEVQEVLRRERTMATVNKLVEDAGEPLDLNQTLDRINQDIIRRILAQENGNQSRTAARLGISRTTLWRLLNR